MLLMDWADINDNKYRVLYFSAAISHHSLF